ncbi:PIN domain-containing protein [Desulfobacula sp.]|uniref:PIN domain-containing protein n=1 Tax=Desulfobacula sp. TaxID=2593537 RepID=UPI002714EC66|nr:PIN domain-containing protein [Desulfobacula sp.]
MVNKIYLDVCALCRPYDDQSYMRINLETIAVQLIFSAIDQNMYDLVYSPVHIKEISAISDQIERFELYHLLQETGKFIKVDKARARKRAERLVSTSFGVADAAHLVFAEAVGADFITCDDKLCKKCCTVDTVIWAGNPVAFCDKEGLR